MHPRVASPAPDTEAVRGGVQALLPSAPMSGGQESADATAVSVSTKDKATRFPRNEVISKE